jgi:hypothetical protein
MAPPCAAADPTQLEQLLQQGYIILRGVLDADLCDRLRQHVLLASDAAVRKGRSDLLGNIQESDKRTDLKLTLCEPVVHALNGLVERCGPLLEEATCAGLGGRVRIVELAAITSSTGAVAQPVHADTMHGVTRFLQSDVQLATAPPEANGRESEDEAEDRNEDLGAIVRAVATDTALIYTCLLALQDVSPDMGPTHVWPATNTVEHHATLWSTSVGGKLSVEEADKAFGIGHNKMLLTKGDLVLYDSRTMHCGGANSSNERRSVFCVSAMGPGIRPDGTTWTMLRSLRNRLMTSDFPLTDQNLAPTATVEDASAALPPEQSTQDTGGANAKQQAEAQEGRPVPPLEEWDAAVQCSWCRRWRPCAAEEAPKLTGGEHGFLCKSIGFTCLQEQGFSTETIDAIFG